MVEINIGSTIEDQEVLLHDNTTTTLKNLLDDKENLVVYLFKKLLFRHQEYLIQT